MRALAKILALGVALGTSFGSVVGCGPREATGTSSGGGEDGEGGEGAGAGGPTSTTATGTSNAGGAGATSTTTTGTSAGGGSSTSTGGGSTCGEGVQDATIPAIAEGTSIGPGVDVKLTGVVAMSQKFLVSKSSQGSCLWGVFLSAPGLTTTEPHSGVLAVSYGFNAKIPEGDTKAYCPRLGQEPAGDAFPDDVKPGDVLDVIGETSYFLLPQCASEPNGSQVAQRQLAKVCKVEKTGTAAVPAAAVISGADLAKLGSSATADAAFHDQWGGVKVRIEGVAPELQDGNVVGDFGAIKLKDSGLEVGSKVYYRGYAAKQNSCHASPVFDPTVEWSRLEGFSYLSFCTWSLQPNDKCADFDPRSNDCTADVCTFD